MKNLNLQLLTAFLFLIIIIISFILMVLGIWKNDITTVIVFGIGTLFSVLAILSLFQDKDKKTAPDFKEQKT